MGNTAAKKIYTEGKDHYSQGRYKKAKSCYIEAMGMYNKKRKHEKAAACMSGIAKVLWKQGKIEESLEMHRRSISIKERAANKTLDLASGYSEISVVLMSPINNEPASQERMEEAYEYCIKASEIQELLAPQSMTLACTYHNSGSILQNLGEFTNAMRAYKKALAIKAEEAPNSMSLALTYNNMGSVSKEQGRWEDSLNYYRKALKIQQKLSADSLTLAKSYLLVGSALLSLAASLDQYAEHASVNANLSEALASFWDSIKILNRIAPKTLHTAIAYKNIAKTISRRQPRDLEQLREALEALEKSCSIMQSPNLGGKIAKSNHPLYLEVKDIEAEILFDMEDYGGAIGVANHILTIQHNYKWAYYLKGKIYATLGRLDSAVSMFEQALRLDENYADAAIYRVRVYLQLWKETNKRDNDIQKKLQVSFQEAWESHPKSSRAFDNEVRLAMQATAVSNTPASSILALFEPLREELPEAEFRDKQSIRSELQSLSMENPDAQLSGLGLTFESMTSQSTQDVERPPAIYRSGSFVSAPIDEAAMYQEYGVAPPVDETLVLTIEQILEQFEDFKEECTLHSVPVNPQTLELQKVLEKLNEHPNTKECLEAILTDGYVKLHAAKAFHLGELTVDEEMTTSVIRASWAASLVSLLPVSQDSEIAEDETQSPLIVGAVKSISGLLSGYLQARHNFRFEELAELAGTTDEDILNRLCLRLAVYTVVEEADRICALPRPESEFGFSLRENLFESLKFVCNTMARRTGHNRSWMSRAGSATDQLFYAVALNQYDVSRSESMPIVPEKRFVLDVDEGQDLWREANLFMFGREDADMEWLQQTPHTGKPTSCAAVVGKIQAPIILDLLLNCNIRDLVVYNGEGDPLNCIVSSFQAVLTGRKAMVASGQTSTQAGKSTQGEDGTRDTVSATATSVGKTPTKNSLSRTPRPPSPSPSTDFSLQDSTIGAPAGDTQSGGGEEADDVLASIVERRKDFFRTKMS